MIFDFTEREDGVKNYEIIEPEEWIKAVGNFHDEPEVFAFEVPVRYGGTIPDDAVFGEPDEHMKAFDIKTGQKNAQAVVEASASAAAVAAALAA